MDGYKIAVTVLGGLGLFLFGMKIMSEALQMAAGDKLKSLLSKVTNNRIGGIFTGFFVTSVIQSSSATTVMVVSFVSAGLITLTQSIGIILGANIGTTVTGWMVAILGFKTDIRSISLIAIALGFFLRFSKNQRLSQLGHIILGFGILFYGMKLMGSELKGFKDSPHIIEMIKVFSASTFGGSIMAVGVGALVTMIIQSSSATMTLTMTLAFQGYLDFPTSCALILGENIGTTITANIAAISASKEAKRSAIVHMLFNVFGVVWVVSILNTLFIPFVNYITPGDVNNTIVKDGKEVFNNIGNHMAAFHTSFNIINTLIFLPFIKYLAIAATKIIPTKPGEEEEQHHLQYISTSLMSTPSININQARMEMSRMLKAATSMYRMVIEVFNNPDSKMGKIVEKIKSKENFVDMLEREIADFLVKISQNNTSEQQSIELSNLLHTANDIERIGDHCEILLNLLRRKYDNKLEFSEETYKTISEISQKTDEFLDLLEKNLVQPKNIMSQATVIEDRINELRNEMKAKHLSQLNQGKCDIDSGLIYIDMLTRFEKIGDHAFNIAQGISGKRAY